MFWNGNGNNEFLFVGGVPRNRIKIWNYPSSSHFTIPHYDFSSKRSKLNSNIRNMEQIIVHAEVLPEQESQKRQHIHPPLSCTEKWLITVWSRICLRVDLPYFLAIHEYRVSLLLFYATWDCFGCIHYEKQIEWEGNLPVYSRGLEKWQISPWEVPNLAGGGIYCNLRG